MFIERSLASLPADRASTFLGVLGLDLDTTDTSLFTLGFQKVAANWQDAGGPAAFEPVALFGYRALDARTGVAYATAMLDTPRAIDLRKTMFLAMAHKAFDGERIADATLLARFEKNLQAFLSLAEAAKHYPCIKRAWVEFLGETPGTPADRVDQVSS